jgi:hypothetical protein
LVSTCWEVTQIHDETTLLAEFRAFDRAFEEKVIPIEELLKLDVRSAQDEIDLEMHGASVEAYRQRIVRLHALAITFLEHSKSTWFLLKKTTGIGEADRRAKEKMLSAPFSGLTERTDGLVKSIDSRVNLCKALLKVADERAKGMR